MTGAAGAGAFQRPFGRLPQRPKGRARASGTRLLPAAFSCLLVRSGSIALCCVSTPLYNDSDSMELSAYDLEGRLRQFNKLIQELLRGRLNRNTFQPWEIEILLDIDSCDLGDTNRRELLKRYQKAANRHFERGGRTLLKLSEYLAKKHRQPSESSAGNSGSGSEMEDE